MRKVLILGGTTEGVQVANKLSEDQSLILITSLAGRTQSPNKVRGLLRTGGFGGIEGLVRYLDTENISAVLDATHPFATQMTRNALSACARAQVPFARFAREPWTAQVGDDWQNVENITCAIRAIPSGSRAFVTTGRLKLEPYFARDDIWILARVIDPPVFQVERSRGTIISKRGPFRTEEEVQLMVSNKIDLVVSKNSGGKSSYGKILAARRLGLKVIMVRQPEYNIGKLVFYSSDLVLRWLKGLFGKDLCGRNT